MREAAGRVVPGIAREVSLSRRVLTRTRPRALRERVGGAVVVRRELIVEQLVEPGERLDASDPEEARRDREPGSRAALRPRRLHTCSTTDLPPRIDGAIE